MTSLEPILPGKVSRAQNSAPHVIAITSGKGGVGKSSISINLGIALSRMGKKVCILDADTGLANINILLGLTPKFGLEQVLFGARSIEEVMLTAPHGMKIIPGANGIMECVDLNPRQQFHLTRELSHIENDFDYLLVDTAAGISETTLDFVRASLQTLLVITPEPTSLTDAFSLVKLLRRRGKKEHFHVVVNMCASAAQSREVFHRFAGAVEKYIGVPLSYLGYLLQDESIRAAVTMQTPVALFPETDPSCRAFFRLGQALEKVLADVTPSASFSACWQSQFRRKRQEQEARRAESQKSAGARTGTIRPVLGETASAQELRDYLSELRTRLLTVMAQGQLPAENFVELVGDLRAAMRKHFDQDGVDLAQEIDRLLAEPEHDGLLRSLNGMLSSAFNKNPSPPVDSKPDSSEPDRTVRPGLPIADVRSLPEPARPLPPVHTYDESRFGGQQEFLARLRGDLSLPLADLVTRMLRSAD